MSHYIENMEQFLNDLRQAFEDSGKFNFSNVEDRKNREGTEIVSELEESLDPITYSNVQQALKMSPVKVGKNKHHIISKKNYKKVINDAKDVNEKTIEGYSNLLDFFFAQYLEQYLEVFLNNHPNIFKNIFENFLGSESGKTWFINWLNENFSTYSPGGPGVH